MLRGTVSLSVLDLPILCNIPSIAEKQHCHLLDCMKHKNFTVHLLVCTEQTVTAVEYLEQLAIKSTSMIAQGLDSAVQLAGLRDMPKQATRLQIDFSSLLGPLFFEWLMQLLLPVFVFSQVHEKEQSLRVMMKMQGLPDRSA